MNILSVSALVGPNVWAKVPVLEAQVDCRDWQAASPDVLEFCNRSLSQWLPGLAARIAASRRTAESCADLPCRAAAAMFHDAALALQTLSKTPVDYARTDATNVPGVYRIVVQHEEVELGRACLDAARRFCVAARDRVDFDAPAELARLSELARDVCLGWTTGAIVAAARTRGIPDRRLDDGSLVQLGYGARQRRIARAVSDRTGKIAESISLDKERTKRLLREVGIPVPDGRRVHSADEAWAAACEVGVPVVVKPCDEDYGNGVSLNLVAREQVVAAFTAAREYREDVIVERFAPGEQHRLTVVGERVVGAIRRDPPRLVGDGRSTITALIEAANRDPRRGDAPDLPLFFICPDLDTPQVLKEQGFDLDSIPPAGLEVVLSRFSHTWAGAGTTDMTDGIHPEVADRVVSAVRLIGLDIAGVDLIARDIGRPLEEQGGVILEVNAEPAIFLHFQPVVPVTRPVCAAIVESLFPGGQTGRIPLAVVTGGDNVAVGRGLAVLLRGAGLRIGRASSDGLYLDDRRIKSGAQANPAGSRALLLSPDVEAAVLERSLDSIRAQGLGVDQLDVAVVSRIGDDVVAPGLAAPEFVEAARVVIESVARTGAVVLDADDPALPTLAAFATAPVILVAMQGDHSLIHSGGDHNRRAVFVRGHDVVLRDGDGTEQIGASLQRAPESAGNAPTKTLLTAVAAAWACRVPIEVLQARLATLIAAHPHPH